MALEVLDLGELNIPPAVAIALRPLIPILKREIKKHDRWLEDRGRDVVRAVALSLMPAPVIDIVAKPKKPGTGAQEPPDLVREFLLPAIEPFGRGAKDEAWKIAKPILIGGIVIFTGAVVASFAIGRATKKCSKVSS